MARILSSTLECVACQEPFEGHWLAEEGEDADEVAPVEHECPSCHARHVYDYPGWTFFTEAG